MATKPHTLHSPWQPSSPRQPTTPDEDAYNQATIPIEYNNASSVRVEACDGPEVWAPIGTPRMACSGGALSLIVDEYNRKIAALANLTADLPRRLCSHGVTTPKTPHIDSIRDRRVPEKLEPASVSPREQNFRLQAGWQIIDSGDHLDHLLKAQQDARFTKELETQPSMDRNQIIGDTTKSSSMLFLETDQSQAPFWSDRFVAPPTAVQRTVWELSGLVLVMYDIIVVPLTLTFKPTENAAFDVMGWIALVYWTLNIPVVLTTGFFSNGVVVTSLSRIFTHYLKTWCIVDLLTVVPDWLFTISRLSSGGDSEDGGEATMKVLRALRFLRLTRLLRMVKLGSPWNALYDSIYSEKVGILVEVVKLVLLLMLVNHFNACLWFVIGNTENGKSWIKHYKFTLDYVDWVHQYLVAYHWSITLFTPASMSLQPQSFEERAFAILAVVLGLVGFSSLVARITSSMSQLHTIGEVKNKSFSVLRKYLKTRYVGHELCIRIRTYLEYRWEQHHDAKGESNVEILSLLSENLKAELASAIHGPTLALHPLFLKLQSESSMTMRRLILRAVSQMHLAPQDWMFHAGEEATHMSMVVAGTLEYRQMRSNEKQPPIEVQAQRDWIAEQVLWVQQWRHLGNLRSRYSTELLRVAPDKLLEIVKLNPLAFQIVGQYARKYVVWLNDLTKQELSDVALGAQAILELEELLETPKSSLFWERPSYLQRLRMKTVRQTSTTVRRENSTGSALSNQSNS